MLADGVGFMVVYQLNSSLRQAWPLFTQPSWQASSIQCTVQTSQALYSAFDGSFNLLVIGHVGFDAYAICSMSCSQLFGGKVGSFAFKIDDSD